jgi:ribonucleoside-diphosphate reductase alpha chain
MDCDTTGIEPDLGLVKTKKLVGGGTMSIVNQTLPRALRRLGYGPDAVEAISSWVAEHGSVLGAPGMDPEHYPVFACSMGDNVIEPMGHVRMMAAVQPFISGAISKTVNMPSSATVEDIESLYLESWRLGLKAVAVYRDGCKVAQPLEAKSSATASGEEDAATTAKLADLERRLAEQVAAAKRPVRERLPRHRRSRTYAFSVADCEGYVTVGEYEDGRPGEVFMKVSKQGSTLAGVMDAFSISISLGLQHGVPLATFVRKYTNMRFDPAGITDDPDLRIATSLVDYIFRRLAVDYLSPTERAELGVLTSAERTQPTLPGIGGGDAISEQPSEAVETRASVSLAPDEPTTRGHDAPYCYSCGNVMVRAGSCHVCPACGTTSGCS